MAIKLPEIGGAPSLKDRLEAWKESAAKRPLTPAQQKAAGRLKQTYECISRAHGERSEKLEQGQFFGEDRKEYRKALANAARLGLTDHPLVQQWAESCRCLGQKDELRRARCGLEKDVQRPLEKRDMRLLAELNCLARRKTPRDSARISLSRESTRAYLIRRGVIPKLSAPAFRKWLIKLDADGLFER